jgi:environmental stress-induced protein Ves
MRIIRAESVKLTPWPNGLGLTRQILSYPTARQPLCQVSLAEITTDCPFSHFADIDRTTVPVFGRGLTLDVAGFGTLVADGTPTPLRYPGDRPTTCRLTDGPMRVLNVMTTRGKASSELTLQRSKAQLRLDPADGALLAWCLEGISTIGKGQMLKGNEGVYTDAPLVLQGEATLIVVRMNTIEKAVSA